MREQDFSVFFKEYYPLVRAYCIARFSIDAYDADDYASEAFGDLWRQWENFSSAPAPTLYSWLCKRARSRFIDDYRRKKRLPETILYDERVHDDIPDIDGDIEDKAYGEYLSEIKKSLGERECKIFEMMVERSLGVDETARCLGIGRGAALTAWYRLRKKLGDILKTIF